MSIHEASVEDEIGTVRRLRPHVVLLGAGASRAALPNGDRNGVPVPLLRDVAQMLGLTNNFPHDLQALANRDFEGAYSRLFDRDPALVEPIDAQVRDYFRQLALPDEATIYDALVLSLRPKDAIFTFNWDPFLHQSWRRCYHAGVKELPRLHFLHGNVFAGYCAEDEVEGVLGARCSICGNRFAPTRLIYPVEHKDYQDGGFLELQWRSVRAFLRDALLFTVFGYSAPQTDVEAIDLLKDGWGDPSGREFEETEIISRPGADESELREKWQPFIHTHHYEIHGSFRDSWLGKHPRRSVEAFFRQNIEAQLISDHPVPESGGSLGELVHWFDPLLDVERVSGED